MRHDIPAFGGRSQRIEVQDNRRFIRPLAVALRRERDAPGAQLLQQQQRRHEGGPVVAGRVIVQEHMDFVVLQPGQHVAPQAVVPVAGSEKVVQVQVLPAEQRGARRQQAADGFLQCALEAVGLGVASLHQRRIVGAGIPHDQFRVAQLAGIDGVDQGRVKEQYPVFIQLLRIFFRDRDIVGSGDDQDVVHAPPALSV
ncbi:hypothetical protein ACHMW6_35835 [Pseudoduganella sp. UC29_106]|uniref:hypothetical protein n=1 Tax=Pseudoduganella sp. UC29_106 TaxID=3374553 RepID=UPI00375841C1